MATPTMPASHGGMPYGVPALESSSKAMHGARHRRCRPHPRRRLDAVTGLGGELARAVIAGVLGRTEA